MSNGGRAAGPGWYPDPAGGGGWRWWDGGTWTAQVSSPAVPGSYLGPTIAAYESSQKASRMIRTWYPVRTAASLAGIIAFAVMLRTFVDFFDELDVASNRENTAFPRVSFGVNGVFQLLGVASLVVTILLIVWILRAATFSAAAGLPGGGVAPHRTPGLAAVSLIIPIVNLWWPWQSVCDCLPVGHPARQWVGRWWILFLVSGVVALGGVILAFVPFAIAVVLYLAFAVLPIAELLVFRRLIEEFTAAQEGAAREVGLAV